MRADDRSSPRSWAALLLILVLTLGGVAGGYASETGHSGSGAVISALGTGDAKAVLDHQPRLWPGEHRQSGEIFLGVATALITLALSGRWLPRHRRRYRPVPACLQRHTSRAPPA